jgi:hypothetical protein
MRVLTIRQPWASAIFLRAGAKSVENRCWSHASSKTARAIGPTRTASTGFSRIRACSRTRSRCEGSSDCGSRLSTSQKP